MDDTQKKCDLLKKGGLEPSNQFDIPVELSKLALESTDLVFRLYIIQILKHAFHYHLRLCLIHTNQAGIYGTVSCM